MGRKVFKFTLVCFAVWAATVAANAVAVCPFCSAINLTFAEQMRSNDIVVIAKLLEIAEPVDDPEAELPKSQFEVVNVLKGEESVATGAKFKTLLVGNYPVGQEFLVMGVDPPKVAWSTPMKSNERISKYLKEIQSLPKTGADRLAFFQEYFEDKESVLAFDAYDEFAGASYDDLKDLKDRMDRPQLIEWIRDTENTSVNRRRLYFTMLGVCGTDEDIAMLEDFIRSGDRKQQSGLDALIACYLTLKGGEGIPLIEETFLSGKDVDYVDTLHAVSALRFHGTDETIVPKEKIVGAVRLLLNRPKMADMIIPDLARWEDWSVMERLVQMFKDADEETSWLRVPVITYLRACPKPEAKKYIEELRKIDPDAVRRADFFLDFDDDDDDWDDDDDDEQAEDDDDEIGDSDSGGDNDQLIPADDQSTTRSPIADESTEFVNTQKPAIIDETHPDYTSAEANRDATFTVSKSGPVDSMAAGTEAPEPAASTVVPPAPVAAAVPVNRTWQIILIPMAVSAGIFLLLWSVLSGWIDRLIY